MACRTPPFVTDPSSVTFRSITRIIFIMTLIITLITVVLCRDRVRRRTVARTVRPLVRWSLCVELCRDRSVLNTNVTNVQTLKSIPFADLGKGAVVNLPNVPPIVRTLLLANLRKFVLLSPVIKDVNLAVLTRLGVLKLGTETADATVVLFLLIATAIPTLSLLDAVPTLATPVLGVMLPSPLINLL